jgi:hypothetical protein
MNLPKNRYFTTLVLSFLLSSFALSAQSDSAAARARGSFYFAWGYNKNWYSTTDVRVHDESGDYDFTIYDLKAHDHTHLNELFNVALSIPQYGYRIGYWMPNQKWGFEVKFDHAKYIVYADQRARIEGKIMDQYVNTDTLVTDQFLHLEHTDGANFLMLNGMWRKTLWQKGKIRFSGEVKFGMGVVVPRSDVTLFGERWNHCFHLAGWIVGAETGVRVELGRYFFIEPSTKVAFANFKNVLAVDDVLISHRFWDGMLLMDFGVQIPLGYARSSSR